MQQTLTEHDKSEFARMAQAAYAKGFNRIGHVLSATAALPKNAAIPLHKFDAMKDAYRAWLVFNEWPHNAA